MEEKCVKKRVKKYVKENPPAEKKGSYDTFRTEVDKATKSMCLTYQELVTRKANWRGIDTEIKKELMTYVISTPFKIIMESKGHSKKVDRMTYMKQATSYVIGAYQKNVYT